MKLKVQGEIFEIDFEYPIDLLSTICIIKQGRIECQDIQATVTCYYTDRFDKRIGRKEAFTKALDYLSGDKEFRTAFWAEFQKHHKAPGKSWQKAKS